MAKFYKYKVKDNVFYTIIGIISAVIITSVLAYASSFQDPLTNFSKAVYPAAIVGGNFISVNEWEANLKIAKKLDPKKSGQEINRVFLDNLKKERLVQSMGISYDAQDINQEFIYSKSDSESPYQDLVKNYFQNSEKLFIKYVVFPSFYEAQLRIKYNQDFKINSSAYNKARSILERINKGEKFEDLAKSESSDEFTGQTGGNLGLVSESQILPELANVVKANKAGEVIQEVIVSRYGYHILYPVQSAEKDGQKVWHLKHILVSTDGYKEWLTPKLSDIWVWRAK